MYNQVLTRRERAEMTGLELCHNKLPTTTGLGNLSTRLGKSGNDMRPVHKQKLVGTSPSLKCLIVAVTK